MRTNQRNTILTLGAAFAVLGLMFALQKSGVDRYYIRILQFWAIYIVFGASFQLLYGYSGLLSLGHAGLIALGSYTVAVLTISPADKMMSYLFMPPAGIIENVQIPFVPALIIAGFVSAIAGFIVAAPALRLGGDYLAMVTLGFAEIIRLILINMPAITNGAMGLRAIPMSATLTMTWAVAMVTIFFLKRLETSRFGRELLAISEDEIGSEALGLNVFTYKVKSFVISSFFAGIGGGLMAGILGTIDPNTFKANLTYAAVAVVVLGGLRSMTGVVVAAGIYTIMSEYLRVLETPGKIFGLSFPGVPGSRVLIFGLMLVLLMLFKRSGLFNASEFTWNWLFSKFSKKRGSDPQQSGGTQ